MKKLFVLTLKETVDATELKVAKAAAKKSAKQLKKMYEKLWGKNTCEVVVLDIHTQSVYSLSEDMFLPSANLCCEPKVIGD